VRELGNHVRSCGRDQQKVRAVRKLDVARVASFPFSSKKLVITGFFESVCNVERRNKFRRVVCHHHENFVTLLNQQAPELCGFVRSDRSSDAENDRFLPAGIGSTFRELAFSNLRLDFFPVAAISINLASAACSRTFQRT
jgi:hypothetical protein